jgi:hypothetical protein
MALLILIVLGFLFKKELTNAFVSHFNQNLQVKVEIDPEIEYDIWHHFPNISLVFKDVRIYQPPNMGNGLAAKAERIFISFDFYKVLHNQYEIEQVQLENGFFHILIDSLGRANYRFLKTDSAQANENLQFQLKKILVHNFALNYQNIPSHQHYQSMLGNAQLTLSGFNDLYRLKLISNASIKSVQLDSAVFLENKNILIQLEAELNLKSGSINIPNSHIEIEDAVLDMAGKIDYNRPRRIDLSIKEKEGKLQTILALLPKQYTQQLEQYQSKGDVYLNAYIKGEIGTRANPLIEVNFGFRDAQFYNPKLNRYLSKVNLKGYFTNGHQRNTHTSTIKLEEASFMLGSNPVKGRLVISSFNDPLIEAQLQGKINAKEAMSLLNSNSNLKVEQGNMELNIALKGQWKHFLQNSDRHPIDLQGEIGLENMRLVHPDLEYPISSLNADLVFNNHDISINQIECSYGENQCSFNGFVKNLIGANTREPLYIEGELGSKKLNLDQLKKIVSMMDKRHQQQKPSATKPSSSSLPPYVNLRIGIDHLHYEKLNLFELKTAFTYAGGEFHIQKLNAKGVGGKFEADMHIKLLPKNRTEVRLIGSYTNIYIDSIFYQSNNFQQSFITHQNIKGQASGEIDAIFDLNKNQDIIFSTAIAQVNIQISNGSLTHFEPLRRLSRFIDEKKLEDIHFSELNNKFFIDSGTVHIPEMNIKSNVSELVISGTHSFDQKIDYRLAVALRSLYKERKDTDEAFGAIAPDHRGNPMLHLTIKGTASDYKIAYDKQRTQQKIKQGLKKEKEELMEIFKKKEKSTPAQAPANQETKYFDFED